AAWSARLFWVQEVVGSNPAAPTNGNERYHARAYLPAAEERDAIRPCRHPRVGAGLRAILATPPRSADGLDRQRGYPGAGAADLCHPRGSRRLCGEEWHRL